MKSVLEDFRRALISERIKIEGEFCGQSATRFFSHDTDHTLYMVEREILTAHEQIECLHRLPLTRRSNRNARLAGQNPSLWKVKPI